MMDKQLQEILTDAYKQKASDIHITTGKIPIFRVNGELRNQQSEPLRPADVQRIVRSLLTDEKWNVLHDTKELDFSCHVKGVSRFRGNAFYQRGMLSLVFRIVPNRVPLLKELQLPAVTQSVVQENQGLVLVTGPTGSGKSSTLAAMINHMNQTTNRHVITLEDPIEYVHKSQRCLIDQREVGVDTLSFLNGLRASLRQDPDVILVGELRDLETISTAITAAETGHLVFGTLHTNSAVSTIERIIDMFPPEQQTQIRVQIASTLKAVIAQQLLPTKDGKSRRAATEVLINTPAVRNLINSGKFNQIQNVLQTSKAAGMHTMNMNLKMLVQKGAVAEDAVAPFLDDAK